MSENTVDFDQDTPPEPMPQQQPNAQWTPPVQPTQPQTVAPADHEVEADIRDFMPASQQVQAPQQTQEAPQAPAAAQTPQEAPQERTEEQPEEKEDVLDTIVPKDKPKTWTFTWQMEGREAISYTWTQKRLNFIRKMQWFALLGEVVDKTLSEGGASISDLLDVPMRDAGAFSPSDFADADQFIRIASRLTAQAPDFLIDSFAIWLNVPDNEVPVATQFFRMDEEEGGLSDDQAIEIIETFIDQNFDSLSDFFGGRVGGLIKRVQYRQQKRKERLTVK